MADDEEKVLTDEIKAEIEGYYNQYYELRAQSINQCMIFYDKSTWNSDNPVDVTNTIDDKVYAYDHENELGYVTVKQSNEA